LWNFVTSALKVHSITKGVNNMTPDADMDLSLSRLNDTLIGALSAVVEMKGYSLGDKYLGKCLKRVEQDMATVNTDIAYVRSLHEAEKKRLKETKA
jgi:hypothetical protein